MSVAAHDNAVRQTALQTQRGPKCVRSALHDVISQGPCMVCMERKHRRLVMFVKVAWIGHGQQESLG